MKSSRNSYYIYKYKVLQEKLEKLIESSKKSYCKTVSQKLYSISASKKCYWYLPEWMLHEKKITIIPPLYHNNNFISNFKEKSQILNEHFPRPRF